MRRSGSTSTHRWFDPDRFAAHEKFFVDDVRRWTASRFGVAPPAERTAVFGVSASGELALALGLRHPDIYSAVFCASPGAGYPPPAVMPRPLPRAYLVAGTSEPFFLDNATRWSAALARRRRGRRHERAKRIPRRRVLAGRAPSDDRLGVRALSAHGMQPAR